VRRGDMTHERRVVVNSITKGRDARAACFHHVHAAVYLPVGRRRRVTAQPWARKQQRGQRLPDVVAGMCPLLPCATAAIQRHRRGRGTWAVRVGTTPAVSASWLTAATAAVCAMAVLGF